LAPETFEYDSITRQPDPPFRPGLSLADFSFLGSNEEGWGVTFHDLNEAKDRIIQIVRVISPGAFIRIFDEWKAKVAECISRDREYLKIFEGKYAEACLGKRFMKATRLSSRLGT
jgi:hypothetical protein